MRVQQFLAHTSPGGALSVARSIDERLVSAGARPSLHPVFVADGGGAARGAVARVVAAVGRVAGQLRAGRPGAVVSHTPSAALLVCLLAWLAGVPRRVVVQHAGADVVPLPVRVADRLFGRLGLYTDVVFVGRSVLDSFQPLPGPYLSRTRVIRNGVDPSPAADVTAPVWPGPGLRALVVGSLDPRKNVGTVLRACAGVGDELSLVVLGDGPDRAALEAEAAALGVEVRFAGQSGRGEVAAHYAAADLLLFPTRSEALPLVLVEALAAGVPVLASDIPPNREVLGEAGAYAPVDDVPAWTVAVRSLLDDPARRSDMARRGRGRSAGFARAPMLEAYVDLLVGSR